MSYELTKILQKCEKSDIEFIINTIDSYVNFSDDKFLKSHFKAWENGQISLEFAHLLEENIRYNGSSDVAYFARKIVGSDPGVSVKEMINDIAEKLKIKLKQLSTIEGMLEQLVIAVFEKNFRELSKEEQFRLIEEASDLGKTKIEELLKKIKGNTAIIGLILTAMGPAATQQLISAIVTALLTKIVGKELVILLTNRLSLAIGGSWLAPAVAIISAGWIAWDLAGTPAFRKTVPIMLCLGLVGLRDGTEEGVDY
jgi:Uncharacterized protein conserved in bacteria